MKFIMRTMLVLAAAIATSTLSQAGAGSGLPLPLVESESELLITVATKGQRNEAWRICRAKYGSRTLGATYVRPGIANCSVGQSKSKLRSRAAARCRKQGLKLVWLGPTNKKTVSYRCG